MLETIDLDRKLSRTAYERTIGDLQERLRKLQYDARDAGVAITICLEGWDTAGKGQIVKKLTERLDPRLYRVHPGTPPTALEARFHFLWRYQMVLPNDGEMVLFDHSWYGRVLVERVDKLTKKSVWRQAYEQINQFERWLADDGQLVIKFWLHISKKEQKKRFRDCLKDPLLKWKITKEYQRHHKEYARWLAAVEEMLAKTDTAPAPWTVVPANDLRTARVTVFRELVTRIEQALERQAAAKAAAGKAQKAPAKSTAKAAAEAAHA